MSRRLQLALNVNDIGEAVTFCSRLFGTEPAKVRPGYANFAIAEPPLKLVLLENPGQGGSLRPGAARNLLAAKDRARRLAAGPVPDPPAAGSSGRAGYLAGDDSSAAMRSSAAGTSQQ